MSVAIHKNYSNSCCQNPANSALEDDHEHDEHRPRFLAHSRYPLVFPFRSFSMLLGHFAVARVLLWPSGGFSNCSFSPRGRVVCRWLSAFFTFDIQFGLLTLLLADAFCTHSRWPSSFPCDDWWLMDRVRFETETDIWTRYKRTSNVS